MKNFKIYILCVSVVVLIMNLLMGCDKDKIDPPTTHSGNIDTVYTIAGLKAIPLPHTFNNNAVVYATVTMDESEGNIYKQLYVQDSTDGILLIFENTTGIKQGSYVRIDLNGATVEYTTNNIYQIGTLSTSKNIAIQETGLDIEPELITIEQINSHSYDYKLVKIDSVEFRGNDIGELTWGDYLTFGTLQSLRDLYDCNDNMVKVLTSGHATFAAKSLPTGNGSIVAIASVYRSEMQLLVRSYDEVSMNNIRCDGSSGDMKTIFSTTFESGQSDFSIENVAGDQIWTYNSHPAALCMAMAGYVSSDSYANEDWLISPKINFTDIQEMASLSFEHAVYRVPTVDYIDENYMRANYTVWISTNYESGAPNSATWKQLNYSGFPDGSNWLLKTGTVDIPAEYLNKNNVRIAFKYVSTVEQAAAWRIKSVLVKGK